MHVDVSVSREEIAARVAAAVAAGGRIVVNEPGTAILADRAGNKVSITAWPDGSAADLGGGPARTPRTRARRPSKPRCSRE